MHTGYYQIPVAFDGTLTLYSEQNLVSDSIDTYDQSVNFKVLGCLGYVVASYICG